MKAPSNDLFFLIKSLSKSEKKYFRQQSERHTIGEQNNYLQLFDAILEQEEYDEAKLKKQLETTSYVNYLAVAKRYLHQQILESLHLFHQVNSIQEKIKKQFHFCTILTQKGLSTQATDAIQKAEDWITEYQLWEYLPLLIQSKRFLVRSAPSQAWTKDSYEELQTALETLGALNWYWQQNNLILQMHYQKVQIQNPEQQLEFTKIIDKLIQKGPPKHLLTSLTYYKALATAAFMNQEPQKAYDYNKKILDLFDNHAVLLELEPQLYLASYNNFLIDNFILQKYDVVETGIAKLRQITQTANFKKLVKAESKVFELTYTLQLNSRIAQSKFKEALELIEGIEEGLLKHKKNITLQYKLQFYYLMAYVFFCNKNYERVLECLDEIRNPNYQNVLEELILAADRLYLITHFELGNYLLLESLMTSIKRAHKKKQQQLLVETVLFKTLKKIAHTVLSSKEKKALFQALQKELLELKKNSAEQRAWVYFDFDKWLQEKNI